MVNAHRFVEFNPRYDWYNPENNKGLEKCRRVLTPAQVNEEMQLACIVEHRGRFKLHVAVEATGIVSRGLEAQKEDLVRPYAEASRDHLERKGGVIDFSTSIRD